MPKFRFTADFDWRAKPRVFVAYKAGKVLTIPRAAAAAAIAAGKGQYIRPETRQERDGEGS